MNIIFHHIKPRSWVSVLICIMTFSRYSHCSLSCHGAVYDSVRCGFGCQGRITDLFNDRKITVINIPGADLDLVYKSIQELEKKSVTYDESTLLRYALNSHDEHRFYCFEAIAIILKRMGYDVDLSKRLTARSINRIISQKKHKLIFVGSPQHFEDCND